VEFDRPGRFAFAITQRKQGSTKDVRYRHTFVLTPEGGGTRRKSLGNLKRKVEASA
jgi:hypothetical protein